MMITKHLCPSCGKGYFGAEAAELFFSEGPTVVEKSVLSKNVMRPIKLINSSAEINGPRRCMGGGGGGGGGKNRFFVQGSQAVKIGQNWPPEFRYRHFVIGRGGNPRPPLTISIPIVMASVEAQPPCLAPPGACCRGS